MDSEIQNYSSLPFYDLNYRELQKVAKSFGLPANLKKNQLCVLIELAKLGKRDSINEMIEEYRQNRNKMKNELIISNSYKPDGKRKRKSKLLNKEDYCFEDFTVLEDSVFNLPENNFEHNYARFGNAYNEHPSFFPQEKRQLPILKRQQLCNTFGATPSISSPPFLSLPPPPPNTPFNPKTVEDSSTSIHHGLNENQVVDHSQKVTHDQNISFQHSVANNYNSDSVRASYNPAGFDLNHTYPLLGNTSFLYQKELQNNKRTSSYQFLRASMRNEMQSQYELQYYEKNLLSLKKMMGSTDNQVGVNDVFGQNFAPFNQNVGVSGQFDNINGCGSRQISYDKQNRIMQMHRSVKSSSTTQKISSESILRNSYLLNESESVYNSNANEVFNLSVVSTSNENLQDSSNQTTNISFSDVAHSAKILNSLLLQEVPSQYESSYVVGNCSSNNVSNDNNNNNNNNSSANNGIENSNCNGVFQSESNNINDSNNDSSQLQVLNNLSSSESQKVSEAVNNDVQNENFETESINNIMKSMTESAKRIGTATVSSSLFEATCRYEMNGCTQVIRRLEDLKQHEQNCVYQPTQCPLKSCDWQSSLNSLHNHFTEAHATEIISRSSESFLLPLSEMRNFTQIHFLQSIKNHIFITTIERVDLQVYVMTQYLKQSAEDDVISSGFLKVTAKNCTQFTWDGEINPYYGSKTMNLRSKGKSLVFDLVSSQDVSFTLQINIIVQNESTDRGIADKPLTTIFLV